MDRETFVVLVLSGYAILLLGAFANTFVSDSWLMLVAGREIAEHGFPEHDTLTSWTAGREWVDQQWLSHLGGYALWKIVGPAGLVLLNSAAAVGALALALAGARERGASARSTAVVALVCLPALLPFTAIRPQTLSYLLFVGLFLILEATPLPTRRTLLCLPILVVWANVHGSALLGAGLVSLWALVGVLSSRNALRQRWIRYAAIAVAAGLCLFATPYGFSVIGYYRRILFNSAFGDVVTEWMRPSFPHSLPFFILAALAAAIVVTPRLRLSVFARAALATTALAGFMAVRYTAWLPLLLAVLAPRCLDVVRQPRQVERHVRVNLGLVAVALGAVAVFAGLAASKPASAYERPLELEVVGVVSHEASRTESSVFVAAPSADWLIWHNPELEGRIAFDIRFELLTEAELRRLGRFWARSAPGWRQAASCCSVLVLRTDDPVTRILRRELRVAYSDDSTTVLVRR